MVSTYADTLQDLRWEQANLSPNGKGQEQNAWPAGLAVLELSGESHGWCKLICMDSGPKGGTRSFSCSTHGKTHLDCLQMQNLSITLNFMVPSRPYSNAEPFDHLEFYGPIAMTVAI